ncbi:hypothetical protein CK203_025120 [Vitis vinifera]|uniref:Uncharacterized protein n=1 Tax=Vitis vinifera TaxID=29760 RepID=A0A438JF96_VITVI|nr:hypothetical protein CK203_025120 [Vitis vinifera]
MLPLIILSVLLTTGPKAFLMVLALPLGQSVLSLAFKKFWGMTQSSPKRRVRTKKKPFASTPAGNGVSVDKDVQAAPKFGGWDELDGREEFGAGSMQRRSARTAGSSQRTPVKGKLSWGGRKGTPPYC